ncbi:MAG: LuxR family transcriptional regulator, partial [Gaiellaceae bacterium]
MSLSVALLEILAADEQLVLAVDDVQWLDPSSASALGFALRRLRDEPVLLLFARRVGRGAQAELEGALAADRIQQLQLGPLSLGALHRLLRARLGTPFARPTLTRLWETSGGNPLFALELARALERRGGRVDPGAVLPIPDNLDELVNARVDVLTRPAREVARVVAVLAEPTVRLVEAAVGSPAARGLADAVHARVLEVDGERIRFTHPLLASATASRTPRAG